MSKHKKQHYIPKCYLKAWCDQNCPPNQTPYIWVFEKESRKGRRKAPENIFHETDMYTLRDENGGRDLTIEHGLSQLEGMFTIIRNKKFNYSRDLDSQEHFIICVFIAAMHSRTRSQLDHMSEQWRGPLKIADDLAEKMKTATVEEKRSMARISSFGSSSNRGSFTHEQVRAMVENPAGTVLLPMIRAVAPLLAKLDFSILYTDTKPGFITSDSPCIWFDPDAYKRPPLYRGPALMYETIEITLPISPTQCILLNRQGVNGYTYMPENSVKEFNRRVRFHSSESFVVNQNFVNEFWYDLGVEPEDSWGNEQERKEASKAISKDAGTSPNKVGTSP